MTGVGAVSFSMMSSFLGLISRPILKCLIPNKGDEYAYEKKIKKATSNVVGIVYFSISTYWGWHMMKNSTWLPTYLGGLNPQGSIEASVVSQFIVIPAGCHCYILFTYGYHVQKFLEHLMIAIDDRDNDWREMFIHHVASMSLYPGFLFGNIIGVGVVLAWLHDIADIFVNITRLFNVLDLKVPTLAAYLVMVAVWAYTRLYILPFYIYKISVELNWPDHLSHFAPLKWLELVFLMVMQLLHIYWFGLFMKIGYRALTKGELKDVINTIEESTDKKQQ